jgi:monoamine oxidase
MPPPVTADHYAHGTAIKMMFRYDTPFWRAEGLSGVALTDRDVPQLVYDNSPEDGSCGVLLGFTEGIPAREWVQKDSAERQAAGVETLVRAFGSRRPTFANSSSIPG